MVNDYDAQPYDREDAALTASARRARAIERDTEDDLCRFLVEIF